jgi:hypothetical protein
MMDEFMIALGSWNFFGALLMIGFFNVSFVKKIMNDWTRIFVTEFTLDYWSKFWMGWAIGLNIFYGLINICAGYWLTPVELKVIIILFDVLAYSTFLVLAIWGHRSGRCGAGIYSVYVIFGFWIAFGIFTFMYK